MHHLHRAVTLGLLFTVAGCAENNAQTRSLPHSRPSSPSKAQPTSPFKPYTACHFEDGLQVAEIMPLPASIAGRTVETMHGTAHVPILRGVRVLFAYPGTDLFANVTVEQLPASSFDESKADLISNFEQILSSSDSTRNYALKPTLNDFEIYGLDRPKLEPGALGVYLLIDNRTGIVTTIRFPNQEPDQRRFSTMEEYAKLRDHFLTAYTSCVHAHPTVPSPTSRSSPTRR
jgi:hypothetical protein